MSLKWVHVFVIVMAIGVSIFFGIWALGNYPIWGMASLAVGIILIPYIFWFISKTRKEKIL